MSKLKLPIIKEKLPVTKYLSMDDYLKFVMLNLKYVLNKKIVRKNKKLLLVDVPFLLK